MTHDTELEQALENQRRYCMSEAARVILALGIDLDPNDHNRILYVILEAREPGSMTNLDGTDNGTGVTSLADNAGHVSARRQGDTPDVTAHRQGDKPF